MIVLTAARNLSVALALDSSSPWVLLALTLGGKLFRSRREFKEIAAAAARLCSRDALRTFFNSLSSFLSSKRLTSVDIADLLPSARLFGKSNLYECLT
jgi:hypothetical protein